MILASLFMAESPGKGRGIFTNELILAHTIIEIAPVIVMSAGDRRLLDKTLLHDYIFEWDANKTQCCMALGFVPIYNHSYNSNCEYFMDYSTETIMLKTVKSIEKDEEVFINYNGDFNDKTLLWFEAK
jgi:SET domain-containing protein